MCYSLKIRDVGWKEGGVERVSAVIFTSLCCVIWSSHARACFDLQGAVCFLNSMGSL